MLIPEERQKASPEDKEHIMAKQTFDTAEAYILGQKYNVLNRKAKKVQEIVANGAKVFIPYRGIVILVNEGPEETITTSVSGSLFFPTVEVKTEATFKP